jgi:O-antigen ligase
MMGAQAGQKEQPAYHLVDHVSKGRIRMSAVERGVLYLGVVLAPFANLRFFEFFFTVSDFFFCLSFLILLISGRVPRRPLNQATQIWIFGFILLFMGLMVSSILRGAPDRGVIVVAQYLFSYLVLMVVLIRDDPKEAYRLAALFLASIILVDIHGIYAFYHIGYVPGAGKGAVTGGKRLATALRNPNLAASMNALTMPILLYFWSSGRLKIYFALPLIAVSLVTVVLTSSNSGLLTMMVCLIVYTASVVTTRLLARLVLGLTMVVSVLIALGGTDLLPATFHKRVLNAFNSGDVSEAGTFVSRTELIKEAINVISEEGIVLVGIGADEFRERSVQSAPVHNLYLLLWVEGGLPALVGWLVFSGVGILIWLAIRKEGGDKHLLAAVATVVSVFLTIAMFNPHMYARYWTLPVLLCFGMGLTHLKRPTEQPKQNNDRVDVPTAAKRAAVT